MNPSDFDYELPDELIARYPLEPRSASRLLHLAPDGTITDSVVSALPQWLRAGDLLVINDTRVLLARLFGRKQSGGRIECLLERVTGVHSAVAQLRASHAPKPGSQITITDRDEVTVCEAEVCGRDGRFFTLRFSKPLDTVMAEAGHVPLPPYIDRADELRDQSRYQTVYATHPGAVAAPTAGLHFDAPLLAALTDAGVETTRVTLHVAAGTFQPLTEQQLRDNRLHAERMIVSDAAVAAIARARERGGRVICVGTTSLRALESAAIEGRLSAGSRETELFIRPGFDFRVADGLLTNFHLPASSLMMLVGAFAGVEPIMRAYAHAVAERYRFFSYGDAMLLWRASAKAGQ